MRRQQGTGHIIGLGVVTTAAMVGLVACAIAAHATGSMTAEQGSDGTLDLAIGGTLFVAMGNVIWTTLTGLISVVLVTLGSDPRRPALVVAGYTVAAVYLLAMMVVSALVGYYGMAH